MKKYPPAPLPRRELCGLKPYEPGKPMDEVRRQLGLKRIIKLASNENPVGPSKKALSAVRRALTTLNRYPDGSCYYLKRALAAKHGVRPENIATGNGSNEIIEFLIRAYANPGDEVLSAWPSFVVYRLITQAAGCRMAEVPLKDMKYDLPAMRKKVTGRTRIIFISNPNNPTGTYVTSKELEGFLESLPQRIIVALDEAYYDFARLFGDYPSSLKYTKRYNVAVMRTFAKAYGLSGLRLGYCVARREIIDATDRIRQPFNINSLAQAAAVAALEDDAHVAKVVRAVGEGRKYICGRLAEMGVSFVESATNFVLMDAGRDSGEVFEEFLRKGIIVRDMRAYGMPRHIRVTVGTGHENRAFITALKQIIA